MERKILVTGGYGFIGSNFIRYSLSNNQDYHIINIDNLSFGSNLTNLNSVKGSYEFIKADINNPNLTEIVKQSDVIVNFAAETHVDRSISSPESFFKTNCNGVLNLLECIRKSDYNPLFIQVGTDEEYGEALSGEFIEGDPLMPSSPYSASKAAASLMTLAYHRTYGTKAIVTRSSNNYGMYQFPEKFIPKAIIRILLGKRVPIYGAGENIRDWIFVQDNVRAINIILEKGRPGEIYNISNGTEISNNKLIYLISKLMNKEVSIEHVHDRPGHDLRYSISSIKLRELGWKPNYKLSDGLKKTVLWYLENESWWKPLISDSILSAEPWNLKW